MNAKATQAKDTADDAPLLESKNKNLGGYMSFSEISGDSFIELSDDNVDEDLIDDPTLGSSGTSKLTTTKDPQIPETLNNSDCCASCVAGGAVISILVILVVLVTLFGS